MSALRPTHHLLRRLLLGLLLIALGPGLLAGPGAGAATTNPAARASSSGTDHETTDHETTDHETQGDLAFRLERLSGTDRYATAAAISARFFGPGVPVALVVTGAEFPDGLAAGPVGDRLGGPVLFTRHTSLPASTTAELKRLKPQRILVAGGTAAVSNGVLNQLDALATSGATRISGPDRYATAAALSKHAFPGGASIAYVATGRAFPDALAGGAAAGVQDAPMLLTARYSLSDATRTELERLAPDRIMLLGGTASVSNTVASQLSEIAVTERVSGSDRYQTALAISRRVFGPDRPGFLMATGTNWPDALAASPATRTTRGPLLLSSGTNLPGGTTTELRRTTPTRAYLLGGTDVVDREIARKVQAILGVCSAGARPSPGSQEVFDHVPGATKQLAFTLDMGGRMDPAMDIVEFLIDNQVCTTFFPTGITANSPEGRQVLELISANPHLFEVGNHTVHHCDLVNGGGGSPTTAPCQRSMTAQFIRDELTGAESTIELRTDGMTVTPYWRPPYGSHNGFVRSAAAQVDYTKTVLWNRDTIDWSLDTTTQQIIDRVTKPLPPAGTIVLAHIGGYRTLDALPTIVSTLRANGYTFTTISDLRDG